MRTQMVRIFLLAVRIQPSSLTAIEESRQAHQNPSVVVQIHWLKAVP